MKCLKFSFILTLVLSLSFSAEIFANIHTFEKEELMAIVNSYNAKKNNLKSLIDLLNKTDPVRAVELKEFSTREKLDENLEIPNLSFEKDAVVLNVFNERFIISSISESTIKLTYQKKMIHLKNEMTLDQMKIAITKLIKKTGASSFVDFLIPQAHADTLFVIVSVVALVTVWFYTKSQKEEAELKMLLDKIGRFCSEQQEKNSMTKDDEAKIEQAISKLKELVNKCQVDSKYAGNYGCNDAIPKRVSCLESLRNVSNSVDKSARSSVKKVDLAKDDKKSNKEETAGK